VKPFLAEFVLLYFKRGGALGTETWPAWLRRQRSYIFRSQHPDYQALVAEIGAALKDAGECDTESKAPTEDP